MRNVELTVIERLLESPERALTEMFTENRSALRQAISARLDKRVGGRVDPSDVVQETLIDACKRLESYLENPTIPFLKWLYLLAEQNAIKTNRRHVLTKKRTTRLEHHVDRSESVGELQRNAISDITDPGNGAERSERNARLQRAISMLSPQSQAVVRMRFLENRTLAEIAEALEMSVDAVAKRAMRGLLKLSEFASVLGLDDSK